MSVHCALPGLDGDPELFQTLLMLPVPIGNDADGKELLVDIQVKDIFGPRKEGDEAQKNLNNTGLIERDANLSLLSYAFNLNPALRRQLQSEIAGFQTEAELVAGEERAVAPRGVKKKIDLLNPTQSILVPMQPPSSEPDAKRQHINTAEDADEANP